MAIHEMSNLGKQPLEMFGRQTLLTVLLCTVLLRTNTVAQVTDIVTVVTEIRCETPDEEIDEKWGTIEIRFDLTNFTSADVNEEVENQVEEQLSIELNTVLTDCIRVEFETFGNLHTSPVTVDVKIIFAGELDSKRQEALKIVYNLIVKNGTLAGISVNNLRVADENGKMGPYTYCNRTYQVHGCPDEMNCKHSDEDERCLSVCDDNKHYCKNGGSCMRDESSDFIKCSCRDEITGERCEETRQAILSDVARYVLIATAAVMAFIILLILSCLLWRKCRPKRKCSRGLHGVENVVALHSLHDENNGVGGISIQTDDSFLLNLSNENGVPPKPGYTHKIMQTNESFLLVRSQNHKIAQVKAQPQLNPSQKFKGKPSLSEAVNGDTTEPTPTTVNNNPTPVSVIDAPKSNAEVTVQTGGSLPRKIVKV